MLFENFEIVLLGADCGGRRVGNVTYAASEVLSL